MVSSTTDSTTTDGFGTESGAGGVLGSTGGPRVTPPATDTASISGPAGTSDGFRFVLLGLAGLLALVLLLQPRTTTVREE